MFTKFANNRGWGEDVTGRGGSRTSGQERKRENYIEKRSVFKVYVLNRMT